MKTAKFLEGLLVLANIVGLAFVIYLVVVTV